MPKVSYLRPDGSEVIVDAPHSVSVMQAAVSEGITEIVAECGGTLACATCHVYVSEDCLEQLSPMSDDENEMLEYTAAPRQAGSRLSCQLVVGPESEGLIVEVPAEQY